MDHDVVALRRFYYQRPLGRVVQTALREQLLSLWPVENVAGMTIAGYGFAVPLMRPYMPTARRLVAMMPAAQGVMAWPAGHPNVSVLVEDDAWPMETGSVDRLIVLHGLEISQPEVMLAEAARVLGPGGRVMIVVASRTGIWARRDSTPFGMGRSYSSGQLEAVLNRAGFVVHTRTAALFAPPMTGRFWMRSARMWERIGARCAPDMMAGVHIVEAGLQIPARPGMRLGAAIRGPLKVLGGISAPAGQPVPSPRAGLSSAPADRLGIGQLSTRSSGKEPTIEQGGDLRPNFYRPVC